jgi:hypothetical protein
MPASTRAAPSVTISAEATDSGSPVMSGVAAAEWFIGSDPGPGHGHSLGPTDGSFGGVGESLSGSVQTAGLRYGEQVVGVRAEDAVGNYGSTRSRTFLVTPADVVFADGFEGGGLGAWSARVGRPRLTVSAANALTGQLGLLATVGSTLPAYVVDESPRRESRYRARFWFSPQGTVTAGRSLDILTGRDSLGRTIFRIQYRRMSGGRPQVRAVTRRVGGFSSTPWATIANRPQSIELAWRASPSGGISLEIGGRLRGRATANTRGYAIDRIWLGPSAGFGRGTSGRLGFDGFVSARMTRIGP